jgi:hypothetical protein
LTLRTKRRGALPRTAWTTANPNLWDRGNTLNVKILNGTLTTYTEAEIDADPTLNLSPMVRSANGYEIIQFTTATLESDGTIRCPASSAVAGAPSGRPAPPDWRDEFVLLDKPIDETVGLDDLDLAMKHSRRCRSGARSMPQLPST